MAFSPRNLPCLPPAVFAMVMSTGTLACATLAQAEKISFLVFPAWALCILNFLIFAILCPLAIRNWLGHKKELACACQMPGDAAFLSTSGISLLVLANQCLFFEFGTIPALLFWMAGAAVTFALNFGILYRTFLRKSELAQITPVLFIPVVGLVVIPTAGSALTTGLPEPWSEIIRLVCILALGAGLLLYSGLFATMLQRHLLVEPAQDRLAPTLWIHLAPLGWGSISVVSLGHICAPEPAQETLLFLALLAWGAAAWWVIMAAALTLRAFRHGAAKFGLGWWTFIFPLGSFTLLTRLLHPPFGSAVSILVWLLMAVIWITAAFATFKIATDSLKSCSAQA